MDKTISKSNAIELACQMFRDKQNEFTELYVSTDTMKVSEIKDYYDEKIFKHLSDNISGWLFFFDPMPFANWGHFCQYLLIVNEDCIGKVDYNRGISDSVKLEKVC